MHRYEVVVGNIGIVYSGFRIVDALQTYNDYVDASKEDHGRAAGETVTMMFDGEITTEYVGENQ